MLSTRAAVEVARGSKLTVALCSIRFTLASRTPACCASALEERLACRARHARDWNGAPFHRAGRSDRGRSRGRLCLQRAGHNVSPPNFDYWATCVVNPMPLTAPAICSGVAALGLNVTEAVPTSTDPTSTPGT